MANPNSSAGVYEYETDLSTRVEGESTGVGVIVGQFEKGPINVPFFVSDTGDLEEQTGRPNMRKYGAARYCAEIFLEESKQLWLYRIVNGATTAGAYFTVDDLNAQTPVIALTNFDKGNNIPTGIVDPLDNLAFDPTTPGVNNILMFFCAANPGAWNNRISVQVRPSNPLGVPVGQAHDVYQFWIDVFYDYTGPNNLPVESHLVSRVKEINADGRQMFVEDVINNRSKYIRVRNNELCQPVAIKKTAFVTFGGAIDGAAATPNQIAAAYEAFEDYETQPGNLFINCGQAFPAVQREMARVCESRGDAVPLLDVPNDREDVISARAYRLNDLNLNTSYAALYAGSVPCYDQYNDRDVWIPLSVFAARSCALVDRVRSVAHAPAGMRYAKIQSARFPVRLDKMRVYKQGDRDALDKVQVNVTRRIKGEGVFINGEETQLHVASAFRNLSVRRSISSARRAIAKATLVGVFDPNDDYLRLSLKGIAESYLIPLTSGPDRSFYNAEVVCDERNNTPEVVAAGNLKIDIFLDPVISAKRIHLTAFIQGPGSVSVEENN